MNVVNYNKLMSNALLSALFVISVCGNNDRDINQSKYIFKQLLVLNATFPQFTVIPITNSHSFSDVKS